MAAKQIPLTITQGDSQTIVLRVETDPIQYRVISAIEATAPLRLTVPGHGVLDGQNTAVTNAKGMLEINGMANALKAIDWHPATVIDADTLEFNDVNGAGFRAYTGGGILQFNTLMDLTGWDARMQIRNKKGGSTVRLTLGTDTGTLAIDTDLRTVTIYLDAYVHATLELIGADWKKGYYDLELFRNVVRGGDTIEQVYTPIEGPVSIDVDTTL